MDIKNALNALLPINGRAKPTVDRSIKAGTTTDRDANGQTSYEQPQQQPPPPMSEEQLQKALQTLRELPAVKDNHLSVELVDYNGKKFVLLTEPNGKVLRKIPEHELWTLPTMADTEASKKGQLLRKTA